MAATALIAALSLSGYAEMFYQWNFNEPQNGLTNLRGFDNRHDSFTIANAVLDALGTDGPVSARVAVQFGHTPETYYLAEPTSAGAAGAGATDASVWKFLQQANAGYRSDLGLSIEAGIFLSPIGPEGIAVKDQWNWSRSNLFFGLPFYHTGVRLSYAIDDRLTAVVMPCNGWNSVVDNNQEKSVSLELQAVIADRLTAHAVYFTGVERPEGAPEGQPWRHLFDAHTVWQPHPRLGLLAHADVGFERGDRGTSWWAAGALAARFEAHPLFRLAARADYFHETVGEGPNGRASAIFWPARWVSSQTLTADLRPHEKLSARLEYRHDQAGQPIFFRGAVAVDPDGAFVPDAKSQDTITAGLVGWF